MVESLLKSNIKWGSRDRRFIADTIYSVVRWYRLFYENYGNQPQTERIHRLGERRQAGDSAFQALGRPRIHGVDH